MHPHEFISKWFFIWLVVFPMVFCIVCLFASLLVSNYDLFNMNALCSLNLAFWTFLATLSSSYK